MVDVELSETFELAREVGGKGHNFKMAIPVCRADMDRKIFGVRVVIRLNFLPSSVVEANTITAFKSRLGRAFVIKLFKFV